MATGKTEMKLPLIKTLTSTYDLNNLLGIVWTGMYYVNGAANAPENYSALLVIGTGSVVTIQILFKSTNIYVRSSKNDGTWNNWTSVALS